MTTLRCLLVAALITTVVSAQNSWTVGRSNVPDVSALYSIAYGNGRFVATAGTQSVAAVWSLDGITWQPSSLASPVQGAVVFVDGTFYLAGSNYIRSSKDGVAWQEHYTAPGNVAFRSAATDGRSMMLSSGLQTGATPFHSSDLITWRPTSPLPDPTGTGTVSMQGVVYYGAGRYYIGYTVRQPNFNERGYAASTADGGITWRLEPQLVNLFVLGAMATGNGRTITFQGPNAFISTDGTTFTPLSLPFSPFGAQIYFAGGRFIAVTETIRTSADGTTWSSLPLIGTPVGLMSIAYGNGRLVGVGFVNEGSPGTFVTRDTVTSIAQLAPPIVTRQPASLTVAEGAPATFSLQLDNPDVGTTFQWRRSGVVLTGATQSSLALSAAAMSDAGSYVCDIRNAQGSTTSNAATLAVRPASEAGRIINLSVLTSITASSGDESSFTVGFVTGGAGTTGTKALLVRAGGPSLARFAVANPNPDPRLELYSGSTRISENDNWGGIDAIAEVSARVGAFPFLSADSRDATVFSSAFAGGNASAKISGTGGTTGGVIAEIYDATPAADFRSTTPRLINVSVLKNIPAGATLSAGFVIGGSTPQTVLIRAIGPGLRGFGMEGVLADPQLQLQQTGVAAPIAGNNDWSGAATLTAAFTGVGAFLIDPSSKDAALVITLSPGNYTAQVSGVNNTAGSVLVEVYEVR